MIAIAAATGSLVLILVLAPFFIGKGGLLVSSSSEQSPEKLCAIKDAIVKRYLIEEKAAAAGDISARTWRTRQQFLTNKYLDAARRLDHLEYMEGQ